MTSGLDDIDGAAPSGPSELGVLPGLAQSVAWDINDSGEVVGHCAPPSGGGNIAFIWCDGEMTALNDVVDPSIPLNITVARAINENSEIVAWGSYDGSGPRAFLLTPPSPTDLDGNCITDVEDLLILLGEWGASNSPADFDDNGSVDVLDLLFLLGNWS